MFYLAPGDTMQPGDIWEDLGTSAATPLWASLAAQITTIFGDQGLPSLGYMNDLLYTAAAIAPASFNDMFGDVCFSDHPGVNVDTFLHVLANSQKMGAWHFAPGSVRLQSGQAFQAHNSGGEVHTFTEVDEFGGGFIPELNALVGENEIAPECDLAHGASPEFIGPGQTGDPEVESKGTHNYQCCHKKQKYRH